MRITNFITKPTVLFLSLLVLYSVGFFAHAWYVGKTVYGDGIFYFSWLHTIAIDHTTDFRELYQHFSVTQPDTPLGLPGNKYSIGPALLWLPSYMMAHTVLGGTGYEVPYQLLIGYTSLCFVLIGLLLLYRLVRLSYTPYVSAMVIWGIACATNLLFYGSLDTVNSHGLSFFAVSLFLSLFLQKKNSWIHVGISLGMIGLIRPQDMLIGLLCIPLLLKKETIRKTILLFIATFVTFVPQLIAWYSLYGSIGSPYLRYGEGFTFLSPHLWGVFFSPHMGLLLYTPLILIMCYGFLLPWRKYRSLAPWIGIVVFLQLYNIASWSTWWQGATYGVRMFVGTLPILIFPFAALLTHLSTITRRTPVILPLFLGTLTILNTILIIWTLIRI